MERHLSGPALERILNRSMLNNIVPSYMTLLEIRQVIMDKQMGDLSKYIEIKKLVETLEDRLDAFYGKRDESA
jgi:hypothetical protein